MVSNGARLQAPLATNLVRRASFHCRRPSVPTSVIQAHGIAHAHLRPTTAQQVHGVPASHGRAPRETQ